MPIGVGLVGVLEYLLMKTEGLGEKKAKLFLVGPELPVG